MATFTITDKAAQHIKSLLAKEPDALGLRLSTEAYGCSGLGYTVDYAKAENPEDELVEDKGVKIYIDRKSLVVIMGTTMDFEDSMFNRGFKFTNPNETGRCGCGESFTV